tara:strand:+ start:108 stop:2426 length:2319 start_codon:yes stop_codon:yes gene_type:complete
MDNIESKKIHSVLIDFLKLENNYEIDKLEILGNWYFRFLISSEEKLNLHIPFYSVDFTLVAYRYVRSYTLLYNMLKQDKITQFEGTCLFDIFNKSSRADINDLILDFLSQKDGLSHWDENTLTKSDNFLPVFDKNEIIEIGDSKTIRNTFELFKSIRNSDIIDFPIQISLKEQILSFNNINDIDGDFISENQLIVDKKIDDDSAMELEEDLIGDELNNRIAIKYPYSKNPHSYLMEDVGKKKFKLIFKNRFAHNDILEDDIYLLKNENSLKSNLKYTIVDTNHSKELYNDFKYFREVWGGLPLNKFTTPFPKYWLLFLNRSLTKEEWVEQFKKDFPAIAQKPIIRTIEKIIEQVIGLNWIEKVVTDKTKILFPDLKSNRKKRLEIAYNNFKKYVNSLNPNVKFIDSMDSNNYENIIVLDAFNIIDLVNKNDSINGTEINIAVPDFLYFGYQPWIKYHLLNYQYLPLINGLRNNLDDNYNPNKEEVEKLKTIVIKEIKSDLNKYRNKYKEEVEENEEGNENPSIEDIEFNNDEEIENATEGNENNKESVIVNQNLETELTILSSEKVLLQRDYLLDVKAGSIQIGDFILRYADIVELYKSNDFYDNLAKYPNSVLKFQTELFRSKDVYKTLKKEGLSYVGQNYFNKRYVVETNGDNFKLPQRKNDWAIICKYLSINKSDQEHSFISYYGKRRRNELIKMYKSILNLLLENNWIGSIGNPEIVTAVAKIVDQFDFIFKDVIDFSSISEAESLINTILNQLTFTEIQTIKTITNE